MNVSLWRKYIFKEIAKTSGLFLFCFYLLFVLIDFAHHTGSFHQNQNHFSWKIFFLYYACEFTLRGELLIPVAILLGCLKTLCKIKRENELLAMQSAGIGLKTLLRPFMYAGLFATLLLYANSEFLLPDAMKQLQFIEDLRLAKKNKDGSLGIQKLFLEDGSQLIFRKYDSARDLFIDAYWIRSPDNVIKMETLNPKLSPASAENVSFLNRNSRGELFVAKAEKIASLPTLYLDNKKILETISQADGLALSKLWSMIPSIFKIESEKEAKLVSTFYRKVVFPWICLLAVLAVMPSCIGFSRHFAPFFIYAIALFGLITLYISIDAAHILAKRQLVDPLFALVLPIFCSFLLAGGRYVYSAR